MRIVLKLCLTHVVVKPGAGIVAVIVTNAVQDFAKSNMESPTNVGATSAEVIEWNSPKIKELFQQWLIEAKQEDDCLGWTTEAMMWFAAFCLNRERNAIQEQH